MFGSLFDDTIRAIKTWEPTKKFHNEKGYSDDLAEFLRDEFYENHNPHAFGTQSNISVIKEAGRGLCDIAINEKIGVELKKDLKSKSQIDRLAGQIIGYKKEYQDIIIVLVGNTNKDAFELLKSKISDLSKNEIGFGLNQELRIRIIDKAPRTKHRKKSSSPFDFGF